jgi:(p)ppGpp synthase/HD superfamily hydrolase
MPQETVEAMRDETMFRAVLYATRAHDGQYRKGTRVPYIVHPLGVARYLIETEASLEVVVAGLLHDVAEDTERGIEEIREAFGDEVASLVEAVTEADKELAWEARKQHRLTSLVDAPEAVVRLSLADKLDNLRAIVHDLQILDREQGEDAAAMQEGYWSRFNRGRGHQKWYYESLAAVFVFRALESSDKALKASARSFGQLALETFAEA